MVLVAGVACGLATLVILSVVIIAVVCIRQRRQGKHGGETGLDSKVTAVRGAPGSSHTPASVSASGTPSGRTATPSHDPYLNDSGTPSGRTATTSHDPYLNDSIYLNADLQSSDMAYYNTGQHSHDDEYLYLTAVRAQKSVKGGNHPTRDDGVPPPLPPPRPEDAPTHEYDNWRDTGTRQPRVDDNHGIQATHANTESSYYDDVAHL